MQCSILRKPLHVFLESPNSLIHTQTSISAVITEDHINVQLDADFHGRRRRSHHSLHLEKTSRRFYSSSVCIFTQFLCHCDCHYRPCKFEFIIIMFQLRIKRSWVPANMERDCHLSLPYTVPTHRGIIPYMWQSESPYTSPSHSNT